MTADSSGGGQCNGLIKGQSGPRFASIGPPVFRAHELRQRS